MATGSQAGTAIAIGRPEISEAAPYYFIYIDKVRSDDVMAVLEAQLREVPKFLETISEDKSLSRYAPGKWSVREVWNHVNDTERVFTFRAMWFARQFDIALPSFDQDLAVRNSAADSVRWADHVEEFRRIRAATIAFFANLDRAAWMRTGTASEKLFSVRALAYITAGHAEHHVVGLREKYL